MKFGFTFLLIVLFTINVFAQDSDYEKRVSETVDLLKTNKYEEGLKHLLGEGTILYNNIFGVETKKNSQISQITNFTNVYGELVNYDLVWSKTLGSVTDQYYLLNYKNYPIALNIVFYKIREDISVIYYKFSESAEDLPEKF